MAVLEQMLDAVLAQRNLAYNLGFDMEFQNLLSKMDFGPAFAMLPLLLSPCIKSDVFRCVGSWAVVGGTRNAHVVVVVSAVVTFSAREHA